MAGLLAVTAAGCGGSGDKKTSDGKLDRSKQFITVLTGPTSGIYFPIGGAFSKVVGEMGYKTSATATGATVENINGIPENKGKKTWVDEKGNIYMDEIGQVFPRIDWLNSHYATREIRLNDQLITSGRLLPEHTRLTLIIEKGGYFDGRFEETLDRIGCRRLLPGSRQ